MPTPVVVLAVLAVSVVAVAMIDLTRHDVRVLPKWAWGIIILVAFPFGVIAYLVMGRSRPGDGPPGDDSIVTWRIDTSGATDGPAARSGVRPAGPPLIVVTGLSKRYGTAVALDRVDSQITRGGTYGFTSKLSVMLGTRGGPAGPVRGHQAGEALPVAGLGWRWRATLPPSARSEYPAAAGAAMPQCGRPCA